MHLSGTEDLETWPESLHLFPHELPHADALFPERKSTARVCKALRECYPEDEVLMRFAAFVEAAAQSNPAVLFSREITFECPDGNQGFLD